MSFIKWTWRWLAVRCSLTLSTSACSPGAGHLSSRAWTWPLSLPVVYNHSHTPKQRSMEGNWYIDTPSKFSGSTPLPVWSFHFWIRSMAADVRPAPDKCGSRARARHRNRQRLSVSKGIKWTDLRPRNPTSSSLSSWLLSSPCPPGPPIKGILV